MEELRYIEFDKFLNNELTDTELKAFEEKLQSDADFKQEFEIYKALETSLSSKYENEEAEKELRNTLSQLGSKYITDKTKTKTKAKETKVISLFNYRKLLVAASIALLIGFFIFKNGNPVYSDFSNHNSLELVVRGNNNETITKAEEAFNTKNYKTAFAQLTILEEQLPNDVEIQLYKGICLIEMDKFTHAETIFNKISKGNSAYKHKATWYKALSLLKQEKFEDCKQVLKTIPESAEEFEQAKKLLKKL
jgi:tetratricopeptide (TPR) repeat protein